MVCNDKLLYNILPKIFLSLIRKIVDNTIYSIYILYTIIYYTILQRVYYIDYSLYIDYIL